MAARPCDAPSEMEETRADRFDAAQLIKGVAGLGIACGVSMAVPTAGLLALGLGTFYLPLRTLGAVARVGAGRAKAGPEAARLLYGAALYALGALGALMGMGQRMGECEVRAAPVIAALERQHARVGRYPEKLSELVPGEMKAVPDGVTDSFDFSAIVYHHFAGGEKVADSYALTYFPTRCIPLRHTYGPKTGRWDTWD